MSFSDPQKNIEQFDLQEGNIVADFGAGSGFLALAAARAVGDSGKVYAIDVQKDLLAKLKNNASKQWLNNIEIVWGNIEKIGGTKLKDGVADAAIVSNILFQIHDQDKANFLAEIKRILKPNGKVLAIDWTDSFNMMGPEPRAVVTFPKAKDLFQNAGFRYDRDVQAGAHHWGAIFRKT